jgi:predicted component of type VI protein secretion system
MHRPTTVAPPMLYAEIRDAIETFEERCQVTHVQITEDPERPGTLVPTVEVEIADES